jgi:ATP-dependent protease HslVU (ClpYQ) peptidase subunit
MQISDFAPFSAVIGALLGAAATYVFAVRAESDRNYQRLRTEAYVDLIRSVAAVAIAERQADMPKEAEATALLADAKTRIAVYGSAEVA